MAERPVKTESEASKVADFLATVATSSDPADSVMLGIFLDNADMETAMIDSGQGETVLSARMNKKCEPEVWLCLRHVPRGLDADVSIAVEHKAIKVGDKALHFEVYVHGRAGGNMHLPLRRNSRAHNMDTVFFMSDWTEAAYIVSGQIGGEARRRLQATNPS